MQQVLPTSLVSHLTILEMGHPGSNLPWGKTSQVLCLKSNQPQNGLLISEWQTLSKQDLGHTFTINNNNTKDKQYQMLKNFTIMKHHTDTNCVGQKSTHPLSSCLLTQLLIAEKGTSSHVSSQYSAVQFLSVRLPSRCIFCIGTRQTLKVSMKHDA